MALAPLLLVASDLAAPLLALLISVGNTLSPAVLMRLPWLISGSQGNTLIFPESTISLQLRRQQDERRWLSDCP